VAGELDSVRLVPMPEHGEQSQRKKAGVTHRTQTPALQVAPSLATLRLVLTQSIAMFDIAP
jgi:hypothetical protein